MSVSSGDKIVVMLKYYYDAKTNRPAAYTSDDENLYDPQTNKHIGYFHGNNIYDPLGQTHIGYKLQDSNYVYTPTGHPLWYTT